MRYAMIMAGGSGTRLWPMSKRHLPKQLIPFINGQSLLEIALGRLDGLVEEDHQYICAGQTHRKPIMDALEAFEDDRYLGEPTGRDTLNAVGFGAAVIGRQDPDAVIAVFTADHIIEPVEQFQQIVTEGYELAEQHPKSLVTFGITPQHPATGFGYLELGEKITGSARVVDQFKEKPDLQTAQEYLRAGSDNYLWNSGMFVWRAATLLDCIKRYAPENHAGLMEIAGAWATDQQQAVIDRVYPNLKKISVDFAVMEPASRDDSVQVAALPMPLTWLDVGSWPSFAQTCETDDHDNALACQKHVLLDSHGTLVASSDSDHLIAAVGCEKMIIVHTPEATLVCRVDKAQDIKKVYAMVGEKYGKDML